MGAMGTGLSWELGADDIDDSLDAEPLVAAADTGEVSGRLGPLLANVFQNQDGVKREEVVLFFGCAGRNPVLLVLPTLVLDVAADRVDDVERTVRAERMDD